MLHLTSILDVIWCHIVTSCRYMTSYILQLDQTGVHTWHGEMWHVCINVFTGWPWPLTYDLEHQTCPRYYQGQPLYQISWPYVKRHNCRREVNSYIIALWEDHSLMTRTHNGPPHVLMPLKWEVLARRNWCGRYSTDGGTDAEGKYIIALWEDHSLKPSTCPHASEIGGFYSREQWTYGPT